MNKMPPSLFNCSLQTQFNEISIVWNDTNNGNIVRRIFLSSENASSSILASRAFPVIRDGSTESVRELAEGIKRLLCGGVPDFNIQIFDFGVCTSFQRKVLLEERNILRGEVLSYNQLAMRLGMPRCARAVGNALAANPFPLVIPCHRTIRADGRVGNFQGGSAMKRALLEMEGITLSASGKVLKEIRTIMHLSEAHWKREKDD